MPVVCVRATRGKYLRAEPVAQLYEQGRVKHAGAFPALEDEMCDFGLDGLSSGRSPDRLGRAGVGGRGAQFWGAGPRVRGLVSEESTNTLRSREKCIYGRPSEMLPGGYIR